LPLVCVCVSFLVITSSAITTSKHLLSLSLHPLLHITSPPITSSYLEPRILPPFIPLLLLSSRRISFRPGIFATQIRHWPDTSLCTETRFWVVGIARNSVENCCGQHFFLNFIHRRHLLALFSCSFRTRLDWGSGK